MPGAQPLAGLGWMVIAQLCFAAMNVFTRLGSRHLPWPEIAAARFATRRRLRPRKKPVKPRARKAAPHIAVTVSIGAAGATDRRTPEEVVKAADKALYRAKENGRNRIET